MTVFESDALLPINSSVQGKSLQLLPDEMVQTLFEQAVVGLVYLDSTGCILWANPKFYEFLDYSPSDLQGSSILSLLDPTDTLPLPDLTDPSFTQTLQLISGQGQPQTVKVTASLIPNANSPNQGVFWVLYPLTDPFQTQWLKSRYSLTSNPVPLSSEPQSQSLNSPRPSSQALKSQVLNDRSPTHPDLATSWDDLDWGEMEDLGLEDEAIFSKLLQLCQRQLNVEQCTFVPYSAEEFPLEGIRQLQAGDPIQGCDGLSGTPVSYLVYPFLAAGTLLGVVRLGRARGQTFRTVEIQEVQQIVRQGQLWIHHARQYRALLQEVQTLQQQYRDKDDFVSTVSHELRNPLSNIRMALRLMTVTSDPEKQREYYHLALQECERQIELIGELLDIQRLTTHPFKPKHVPIYLRDWLTDLTYSLQPRFQEKQLQFTLITDPQLDLISSDPVCLGRILTELLSNAVKYTAPTGSIDLTVQRQGAFIAFTVANTGSIEASELDRIFDRFYRIPQSDRWKHGGSGLGLALVKQLVLAFQGSIQVKSAEGWVTFQVWIPV